MKIRRFILPVIALLISNAVFGQNQYETITEANGKKIYKGIISRELIETDTSYKWYAENLKGFTPQASAVAALNSQKDSLEMIVFMGTWCGDSHFIIPKFFSLTDAAGFAKERVTLLGTDRQKKTLSHLAEALNVKNVPTIIVMKNGKELGRVVEYGKYGMFDKELGEIINSGK